MSAALRWIRDKSFSTCVGARTAAPGDVSTAQRAPEQSRAAMPLLPSALFDTEMPPGVTGISATECFHASCWRVPQPANTTNAVPSSRAAKAAALSSARRGMLARCDPPDARARIGAIVAICSISYENGKQSIATNQWRKFASEVRSFKRSSALDRAGTSTYMHVVGRRPACPPMGLTHRI